MELILKRSPQGYLSFELRVDNAEDEQQRAKGLALYNLMDEKADRYIKERMQELKALKEKNKPLQPKAVAKKK